MRDPKRIKSMLKKLEKVWANNPDMRLGQLVENLARFPDKKGTRGGAPSTFYVEDDIMDANLDRYIEHGWDPEKKS